MTWSIIARDSTTGQIGIAVATKFFAVGALVPHIAPMIGGVATQALVNPYYGIDGIKLLREGKAPPLFAVAAPAQLAVEFVYTQHADRAYLIPGTERISGTRLEYTAPDIVTAHRALRAMTMLARD